MILEALRVAWMGVASNKLRTFLTALGVIIGVSAVIILVSVGEGTRASITSNLQSLGSNLIMVSARGQAAQLEMKDREAIMQVVPDILYVEPNLTSNATVKSELEQYDVTVEGVTEWYPVVRDRTVSTGSFLTADDVQSKRAVAVLGATAAEKLFPGTNPVGQTIRLMTRSFTVIGVTAAKGTGITGADQDDLIFVPITTLQRALGQNRVLMLYLKMSDTGNPAVVTQQITDFYSAKFRREEQVRVQSQDQLLETVGQSTAILTAMLGSIAGISLLVGGIGIMNIMLVSVSERTREIGIRKAIGAKNRDIMMQFLIEALILSLSGGAIGIAIGYAGSRGIATIGLPTLVSPLSVMTSFAFSAAVGIFFGLYPAVRAANLDPIEALRRE